MKLSEIEEEIRQAYYREMDDPAQWLDDQIRIAKLRGESTFVHESMRRLFDGPHATNGRKRRVARKKSQVSKAGNDVVQELENLICALKLEVEREDKPDATETSESPLPILEKPKVAKGRKRKVARTSRPG